MHGDAAPPTHPSTQPFRTGGRSRRAPHGQCSGTPIPPLSPRARYRAPGRRRGAAAAQRARAATASAGHTCGRRKKYRARCQPRPRRQPRSPRPRRSPRAHGACRCRQCAAPRGSARPGGGAERGGAGPWRAQPASSPRYRAARAALRGGGTARLSLSILDVLRCPHFFSLQPRT